MTTLNLQVGHNDDDAHENDIGGNFHASFGYIKMTASPTSGYRYNGGFRFTTVTVPKAATIDAASVQVYLTSLSYASPDVDILANDVDDANDFSTEADVTSRARTTASVGWVGDDLGLGWKTSPEIPAVIKEIVDREGWASGQALCVLIDGTTADKGFFAEDYGYPERAAKLDIDYTAAAGGVTVTPPTATLITSAFVPVIKLVVIPAKRTLSLATFTPVLGLSVIPPPLALSLTTFVPTVTTTANVTVTPGVCTLSLSLFAPTITTTANVVIIPGVIALSLTAFAPIVTTTGDVTVTPGTVALSLATFAPVIKITVTPPTLALNLQTFAPTISTPRLVTPPTATLSLAPFAPTVSAPRLVTPGVVSLSISAFAPTVTVTGNVVIIPGVLTLSLGLFAPTVFTPRVVTPGLVALSLTAFIPTITVAVAFTAVWTDSGSVALLLVLDGSVSLPQAVNDGTISIRETEDATV